MAGLLWNEHKAFVTAFFWILRFIVHHDKMDSDLSWWPIGRLDLILRSAPIIFGKIHVNVDMIWRKILFEVLLLSELRRNPAYMAAKCRCIFLQKGFGLCMTDRLSYHFHFFGCFTLVHNFNPFPNVMRETLLFYIVNNWRAFLITVFDKCFSVCWNACVFSKHLFCLFLFYLFQLILRWQLLFYNNIAISKN